MLVYNKVRAHEPSCGLYACSCRALFVCTHSLTQICRAGPECFNEASCTWILGISSSRNTLVRRLRQQFYPSWPALQTCPERNHDRMWLQSRRATCLWRSTDDNICNARDLHFVARCHHLQANINSRSQRDGTPPTQKCIVQSATERRT